MTNNRQTVGRILFIGASYYNNWYLSRSLRKLSWKADMLTYPAEGNDLFSHGADFILKDHLKDTLLYQEKKFNFFFFLFQGHHHPLAKKNIFISKKIDALLGKIMPRLIWGLPSPILRWLLRHFLDSMRQTKLPELKPLYDVLDGYDILHFTGVQNLRYFYFFNASLFGHMPIGWDIELLKRLGKKITYTNTGCLDGVTQSSFRKWEGPEVVCDICPWHDRPEICSDERNRTWGELRNRLSDYQITLGGNRVDFNDDPKVHEVPEFYCLDPGVWHPEIEIPSEFRLNYPEGTVKVFHTVGNYQLRTDKNQRNLKSTHIYTPLVEKLKSQGYPVEMMFIHGVPNLQLRFYQAQADIFVDMLTFGFFGATVREGLMLGKPVVCYLRPQWLESMRCEIPEYVTELPVISATPDTVEEVLKDLIMHPEKRAEIGRRSRAFAMKWHSAEAGAHRLNQIYSQLLKS